MLLTKASQQCALVGEGYIMYISQHTKHGFTLDQAVTSE
jgi:hypothetical protein